MMRETHTGLLPMQIEKGKTKMNRKEFIKVMGAAAGAAAFGNIGCAGEETKKMSKSIIIYFSHTGENYSVGVITVGNTAKVAKEIAAQTGAETWEIKEKNPYPEKYTPCIEVAKKEMQAKARPEFVGEVPDLSAYDTIYLGYPNWWADAPMVVYSFLDKAKIDGKKILPFCPDSARRRASWRWRIRRRRWSSRGLRSTDTSRRTSRNR